MILDFGKNKGKTIAECESPYLKWLVSHEKVLAKRNRWASRDAKFILEARETAKASAAAIKAIEEKHEGNHDWNDWHKSLKSSTNDISLMGNLHGAKAFSLLR